MKKRHVSPEFEVTSVVETNAQFFAASSQVQRFSTQEDMQLPNGQYDLNKTTSTWSSEYSSGDGIGSDINGTGW